MKKFMLLFLMGAFWTSCTNNPPAPKTEEEVRAEAAASGKKIGEKGPFLGSFTGDFVPYRFKKNGPPQHSNKITIIIDIMADGRALGRSVVAGNLRSFEGTFSQNGNEYAVQAKEPGDDKYDGSFNFVINTDSNTIVGTWKANDNQLAVTERSFKLAKREFSYNPDLTLPEDLGWAELYDGLKVEEKDGAEFLTEDVLKFNASKQLLKKSDIENMYKGDIEVLRNSIFARHGYSFKNRKMRFVFDKIDWYMPISLDVSQDLTDIEKQNVDLLKRYEQHAERYYDAYGR